MGLTSLFFRDTFKTKVDYSRLVASFRTKLDENFFKGYIGRDETQLFYFSGAFRRPLSANLPIIQIDFENKVNDEGQTVIQFKIANFVLALFGVANGIILFFALFDLGPNEPVEPLIGLATLVFSYGLIVTVYMFEMSGFTRVIEQLEAEQ